MTGSARRNARSRLKSSTPEPDERRHSANHPILDSNLKLRRDKTKARTFTTIKALVGAGFAIFALLTLLYLVYSNFMRPPDRERDPSLRVVTPFPSPKLMDLPQFQGEHKESLFWGTYRPHVYLGIRARTPRSLIAGLMWIGIKDGQFFLRHICQDSDGLSTYGWTHHNGRDFGEQLLVDQHLTLKTSFLKSKVDGSGYGGDWAVRVDVQSKKISPDEGTFRSAHLFFYVGEEDGTAINLDRDVLDIRENSLLAFGSRLDLGDWQLHLDSMEDLEVHYSGFKTPYFHNLSDLVQADLADQVRRFGRLKLSDTHSHSSNVLVFQISGKVPFKADIAFLSGTDGKIARVEDRLHSLTGELLSNQLAAKKTEFDDKFDRCFNLTNKVDADAILVGKAAIGNLLGGIGYFYGQSKIALPTQSDINVDGYISYWPAELYTAVPSRSFFPRGFLWDEGFHQLLIWRWDIHICLDIIGHWLDLMNVHGWIPREQILGAEALSKVPKEFVLQHPTNGNPPTLFLVLHDLVSSMRENRFNEDVNNEVSEFLERAFVRLDAWFRWFNTTQSGKDARSYFWHGRDSTAIRELNPKALSSGLDDYPRASHPDDNERHLDLRCWMLLAADCMHSISERLRDSKLQKAYDLTAKLLSDFEILNQLHFDKAYGAYFDFGNHTEKVRLSWQPKLTDNYAGKELVREVLDMPVLRPVPHIGYVSLFPFMGRIIPPESSILGKQLDLIANRSILWTDYGIRSLAKTSSLYMKRNTEHDPPYWRGPIWMNMNYMILSSLHYYSQVGPYKERAKVIYDDLRGNLIRNVVKNYQKAGYLWEQYDQKTGKGKGARPFTGWTSLSLLIMAETYSDGWSVANL